MRPRKSTIDALIDQFAEFTLESQERALDLMQFEHRRAKIRATKTKSLPGGGQQPLSLPIGENQNV